MRIPSLDNGLGNSSFLVEHVGDAVGEHSIGSGQNVERFAQQHDLAVGCRAVTKESLVDKPAGDPGFLVDRVFTERLVGGVNVNLDVDELETRIHLVVEKREKGSNALRSFVSGIDAEIGKIGEFECAVFREQS